METWSKFEPFLIIASILLGYALSSVPTVSTFLGEIEEPLFLFLIFFIFLEVDWVNLKKAFGNISFLKTELIINFLWTPILVYLLGVLFFYNNLYLRIALALLLILPCTDWYLVFTEITGGDVELSTSILPYNLILQLIMLPVCLYLFFGRVNLPLDYTVALSSLLEFLIPFGAALVVQFFINRSKGLHNKLHKFSHRIELGLICLIAMAIFAADGGDLISSLISYPLFIVVIALFYLINFIVSFFRARQLNFSKRETISLVFTTTARNSPLSLTLSALLFSDIKIITTVLLIGPITEIPFSLCISYLLRFLLKKNPD